MAKDIIYGEECDILAKKAGESIIRCKNIKCNYCNNCGSFIELYKSLDLDEEEFLLKDRYINDSEFCPDWKVKYYYLIKCKKCNGISLCTFETSGVDEYEYESCMEDEREYSRVDHDVYFKKRLEASNFQVLFPLYNENNIIINKVVQEKFNEAMEIYKQAKLAEELKLNHICGMGYRKALEFLIKDYCIQNNPDLKGKIESELLGKVIDNYIKYEYIKDCAKCAAWLGNDETHYIRKWNDKDINDLKALIDLTIKWISMDIETKHYSKSMLNKQQI